MAGGLPTRRRSSASAGGSANQEAAAASVGISFSTNTSTSTNTNTSTNTGTNNIIGRSSSRSPPSSTTPAVASRSSKRRSRGLPTSASSTTATSSIVTTAANTTTTKTTTTNTSFAVAATAPSPASASRSRGEAAIAIATAATAVPTASNPSAVRSSSSSTTAELSSSLWASPRPARASPRGANKVASLTAVLFQPKPGKKTTTTNNNSNNSNNSKMITANKVQVTLKVGGKLFVPMDTLAETGTMPKSQGLATRQRRQRSASFTKTLVKLEEIATAAPAENEKEGLDEGLISTTSPSPVTTVHAAVLPLGHDGNSFYCGGCGEVGDVVCCDGCPRVYHRECVPKGPSKISLEQDDDPWFCPDCYPSKHKKTKKSSKDGEERTCFECNEKGIDLKQCQSCEGWIHFPACFDDDIEDEEEEDSEDDSPIKKMPPLDPDRILCRICRVEELEVSGSPPKSSKSSPKMIGETDEEEDDEEDYDDYDDHEQGKDYTMTSKQDSLQEDDVVVDNDDDDDDDGDDDCDDDDDIKADRKIAADHDGDGVNDDSQTDHMDVDDATTNSGEAGSDARNHALNMKSENDSKRKRKESSSKSTFVKSQLALAVKQRSRLSLPSSKVKANMELEAESATPVISSAVSKKKKKENKKIKSKGDKSFNNPMKSSSSSNRSFQGEENDGNSVASSQGFSVNGAYPKAIPAFFFFLNESRLKIERHLARKHRTFNRLPKGYDRNELIAKEGALWWSKLREGEIRRFMGMSMRDFEQRIIEWKEEKNIRDMMIDEADRGEDQHVDVSPDDELLTYKNHQRLYLGTNVGSKPFKPELDSSRNRILLELLQDLRFHPMPMLIANRTEVEYGQMDFDRVTIPYFDVHGPISTSVGDECMGCTRGWTHYCNVLKRRIPAVEHRAKLQPPLSTLMATRVGLGLRPRAPDLTEEKESEEIVKNLPLFSTRDMPEVVAAKKLPMIASDSLSNPSSRADDIVQFIEETVYMKVPEPTRPDFPGDKTIGFAGRASVVGTSGQKRAYDTIGGKDDRDWNLNKCGRCRTVICSDTGCIPCRRAQLVINMSKHVGPSELAASKPGKGPDKGAASDDDEAAKEPLKVQTLMCGRIILKDSSHNDQTVVQSEADIAIANGILRQRWTPFTVLPPRTIISPTPKSKLHYRPPTEHRNKDNGRHALEEDATSKNHDVDQDSASDLGDDNSVPSTLNKEAGEDCVDDNSSSGTPTYTVCKVPGGSRPTSKRLRSARVTASHAEVVDEDRHELALKYKKEADDLNKKCVGVACCGILLALMRRDPLLLFASPVTAEGYSAIIKNPIDFSKIRKNVLEDQYGTLGSFVSDCRLLCMNALTYNPPGSIYWKTAKELHDMLTVMQKRVSKWMHAIKDAHAMAWRKIPRNIKVPLNPAKDNHENNTSNDDDGSTASITAPELLVEDPFSELRRTWPEAVEMLEDSEWLRRCISADFMRTRENETAYYGALAVRRTAAAAETALAAYPDSGGMYNPVTKRTHTEDEALRRAIEERISEIVHPVELKDLPSWREDVVVRVLRRAQSRRLEGISGSKTGCARCDGNLTDGNLMRAKLVTPPSYLRSAASNKRGGKINEVSRINASRIYLSTGMASQKARDRIENVAKGLNNEKDLNEKAKAANEVAVTVRGSGIHGWGLFADQSFRKGDVVAEYIGEYVSLAVAEARERLYQEQRIQDYQFRLDDQLVIDATMRGGHGRYINHNCHPNCIAKIIPGAHPNPHLKRVIIMAQRDIEPREELSYDYQFPLELDLNARIPCNCMSDQCRGFMNWDIPEKGSNNHVFRSQKRGANMRDRIRRLGRPLKSEKGEEEEEDADADADDDED